MFRLAREGFTTLAEWLLHPTPKIDWHLTTWECGCHEHLRRWRQLSLRDRLRAVEDMVELSRRFQECALKAG